MIIDFGTRNALKVGVLIPLAATAIMTGLVAEPASAGTTPDQPENVAVSGYEDAVAGFIKEKGAAYVQNQEALQEFKGWILKQSGIESSGFVESVNDADHKATTLLWKGKSQLQSTIAAEGTKRGISVSIQQRKYSFKQIEKAAARVLKDDAAGKWKGFSVASIAGISADYDGIVVQGSFTDTTKSQNFALGSAAKPAADAGLPATAEGVPVKIASGFKPQNFAATRGNDTPSFNAGGMMKGAGGSGCSTGFAIRYNGVARTTTARHCVDAPYRSWSGAANYGKIIYTPNGGGARILNGSGWGRMFDGAWNNSTGYYKTVKGLRDLSLNDTVCTSGANSGVHCNIKVNNMYAMFDDKYGAPFPTIQATQQNGGIAGAQGDSGGPVFTVGSSNVNNVYAAGMIQGSLGSQTTNCGSLRTGTGQAYCSSVLNFTSMRTIINNTPGSGLVTG